MVCDRCIMVVRQVLETLSLDVQEIKLGQVELANPVEDEAMTAISDRLKSLGFELINDRKKILVEKIKTIIISLVHGLSDDHKINLSTHITNQLPHDYNYLSNLFTEIEGNTIEKYFIAQKIERIKELLRYDEWSLSEIAYQLNYSSVAYLSNQFKKVTGITPTEFKQSNTAARNPLDKV